MSIVTFTPATHGFRKERKLFGAKIEGECLVGCGGVFVSEGRGARPMWGGGVDRERGGGRVVVASRPTPDRCQH